MTATIPYSIKNNIRLNATPEEAEALWVGNINEYSLMWSRNSPDWMCLPSTGIEIEMATQNRENIDEIDMFGLKVQNDSSINPPYDYDSVELATAYGLPALGTLANWYHLAERVDYYLDPLFTDTSGIHVTVGTPGMKKDGLKSLLDNYRAIEQIIFGLNGDKAKIRWGSRYCKPLHRWDRSYSGNKYNSLKTKYALLEAEGPITAHIEFRMFAAHCDPELLVAQGHICASLVSNSLKTENRVEIYSDDSKRVKINKLFLILKRNRFGWAHEAPTLLRDIRKVLNRQVKLAGNFWE